MNVKTEFRTTEDGSHTLYRPDLDEHYHSVYGAIGESQHIFIESGLLPSIQEKNQIDILEVGFGTGLNALLTLLLVTEKNIFVNYTAIELYPLDKPTWSRLNYPEYILKAGAESAFGKLHDAEWGKEVHVNNKFTVLKLNEDLLAWIPAVNSYDLVYFDAFGPDVQPELWTEEIFMKIYHGLRMEGVLVTYSTKGAVKRNLKSAGFGIEKLPGPKGKREILRACKFDLSGH
jgi:tRNA U34 5-methylaminomethyl-2-thiouridine-forming methyltransferase MnmC